ncbi:hypothetical protein [Aurantibacter sp.]|uniref:hypothetical protein n=1 Tax=Aurantibacter sp. TaxID=2807103 RepID=UPI0035C83829
MKNILLVICLFLTTSIYAQNVNKYKYVLVPEKFEFLKEADQYRLNGLTNFLLKKNGFNSYLGKKDVPEEALNNNCINLFADVVKESNMFKTKVALQLKDCRGEVVYTSPFGASRSKSYKVAYNEALRAAAEHLSTLNYKYDESETISDKEQNSIEKITETIVNDSTIITTTTTKIIKEVSIPENEEKVVLNKVVEEKILKTKEEEGKLPTKFYAKKRQKIGWEDYNIVDENGVLYFVFYSTGKQDTFLVDQVKNKDKMLCFKENDLWHLVSRDETKMEIKALEIEFEK